MAKDQESTSYIRSTPEGKLYITTEDFFKQPKIQETIDKLMDSDLYKEIVNKK